MWKLKYWMKIMEIKKFDSCLEIERLIKKIENYFCSMIWYFSFEAWIRHGEMIFEDNVIAKSYERD